MKFFRFIAAALFALALVSCNNGQNNEDDPNNHEKSPFKVRVGNNVVQMGIDHAYFLVTLDDQLVDPSLLVFFDADKTEVVEMNTYEVEIDGEVVAVPEWIPTKAETKRFWVAYNSYNNQKNPVSITALDFELPKPMVDPQPENVSFVKRAFLNQFTGTECGYCPYAISSLYKAANNEKYADKFINVAIHTYSNTDPMYPKGYANIETSFGVSNYPTIAYDMMGSIGMGKDESKNDSNIETIIETSLRNGAKAGIAVSVASGEGDTFVARASVKAGVDGEYSVGAWLVEDNIEARQENYGCKFEMDYNTHESALCVADSFVSSNNSYLGHSLGAMQAGEIKDYIFVISTTNPDTSTKARTWVKENMRLVVFVSTKTGNRTHVTNVVTNSVYTESIAFEYAE